MKQLNVPKKVTAPLMMWVSLFLIATTLLFSFMPLMRLDTTLGDSGIGQMVDKLGGSGSMNIPEKVDISAIKILGAVRVVGSLLKDSSDGKNQDLMDTKAGQETAVIAAAIATTVVKSLDFENGIVSALINILITLIALIYVLIFVFVIPIKLVIMFVKALVPALANTKTPELGAAKVGNKLPKMLSIPFTMMIFQSFIPGMTYGWGLIAITVIIILSVLFCTVLTRLRTYEPKKFRYLNILQGTSLVAIIGFLVFFFSILKVHVLNNFLVGPFVLQVAALAAGGSSGNSAYIIDFVLIFAFAIAFLSAVKYLSSAANRLSCTVSHKKVAEKKADSNLWGAIGLFLAYLAPKLVSGWNHYAGKYSFLTLNDDEKSALTVALIGIIIMIAAEVALIVLKKNGRFKRCLERKLVGIGSNFCGRLGFRAFKNKLQSFIERFIYAFLGYSLTCFKLLFKKRSALVGILLDQLFQFFISRQRRAECVSRCAQTDYSARDVLHCMQVVSMLAHQKAYFVGYSVLYIPAGMLICLVQSSRV